VALIFEKNKQPPSVPANGTYSFLYLRENLSNETYHAEGAQDDGDEGEDDDEGVLVVNEGVDERLAEVEHPNVSSIVNLKNLYFAVFRMPD